ncbi:MAG: MFS transporter [Roseiflexaceae bacterium]
MALFKSLAHRPFLLLWSGQAVSRLGDSLYQIALAWWVLERTGSAAAMGAVFICGAVPTVVFALIGGVAVDRLPRVRLMLGADALRGVLATGLAALATTNRLEIWHIGLASALFGLVSALFLPAYTALIPDITPRHLLPSANALTSLSAEITSVVGPALGAYLIGRGGPALAFALDGGSFLFSALCLLSLRQPSPTQPPKQGPASILGDLRAGLQTAMAASWLWMTIGMLALLNLTGRSPMNVALPFLVRDSLRADVDMLGILYSVFSLGSIAGAVWAGQRMQRRGLIVYRALTLVGLATLALGLPLGILGSVLAILILGAALAVANLAWSHIIQEYVPAHMLGRVASITLLGSTSLLPLGFALSGWATDRLGPAPVFAICGTLTAALAALGLLSRAIRELE